MNNVLMYRFHLSYENIVCCFYCIALESKLSFSIKRKNVPRHTQSLKNSNVANVYDVIYISMSKKEYICIRFICEYHNEMM